jgi:hypothetical protein
MTRRGGDAETRRARNRIGIPVSPCPRVPVSVLSPNCRIRPSQGGCSKAMSGQENTRQGRFGSRAIGWLPRLWPCPDKTGYLCSEIS